MEDRIWRRGQKADYTDRPLTDEERAFAADAENYNQLFKFMSFNKLDTEEWYDILIIPYLQAVKKYCSRPELHIYPFHAVSNKVLSCAYHHYWRSYNTQKNMPEGGIISLDFTLQGDNQFSEHTLDEMWVDRRQQVERVVLDREMLTEIMLNLDEVQSRIFEMLLVGYNKREIVEELCITLTMLQTQLKRMQKVVADYLSI